MKKATYIILLCAAVALATGCSKDRAVEKQDDVVKQAYADIKLGAEYDRQWKMRLAELYYKKAYDALQDNPAQRWYLYSEAGYRYACMLGNRGEMEQSLTVISDILSQPESPKEIPARQQSALHELMAQCQAHLGMLQEAKQSFAKSYAKAVEAAGGEGKGDIDVIVSSLTIASHNLTIPGEYEEAEAWLRRCEDEFHIYEQHGDPAIIEEYRGIIPLLRASYLQLTGHAKEAAQVYAAIPRSSFSHPKVRRTAITYLTNAGRYAEAADMFSRLDSTFYTEGGSRLTFDAIKEELYPRYEVNRKAGRGAEAMNIADKAFNAIDSALSWQKKSDAAELAIIYQTHEKELALEESETRSTIYCILAIGLAVILVLIASLLLRAHKYNKVLADKNRRLLAEIEQRERGQQQAIKQLNAEPEDALTVSQQFYRRLCTIMAEQKPYTNESLNRDTLAQLLGTNAKYVEQVIRECSYGETVGDFINRYRLEHVARLLKTTDDSISLIGEQSGIPSRATLARIFRNAYGMTCSEYRQAVKSKATEGPTSSE